MPAFFLEDARGTRVRSLMFDFPLFFDNRLPWPNFPNILQHVTKRYNRICHACCLMDNHCRM